MKPLCQRLAAVLLALPSFQVSATTRYVDVNNASPASPYTNWVTAATNIQDAVFHAGTGDTVLVTNGIYQYGGYSVSGLNRVYVINNLTVQSVNGPAVTVIQGYQVPGTTNGANAVRCVYLNNGTTLSGFTLTNGATQNFGFGGGVYCQSTNCLVTNCVITGNAAYDGGGGAYYGTLVNCSLIGNMAGAFVDLGNGGGAYYSTLVNCVLARNFTEYVGGAAGFCTLINCTVVSNSVVAYNGSVNGCTLKNCIVYYNFSYYTNADSGDGNFTNCCTSFAVTFAGANNFTNLPLFANLSAGDFHLNAASPCINAGNNSFITNSTDLDGNPRIVGGTVDMGAYEFQAPVRYVSVSNTAPVSPFTNWVTAATNIQDAIDVANAGDFIVVSNGIYQIGGRTVNGYVLTNRVVINKAVTVQSINGPASTVIAGLPGTGGYPSSGYRCVYLTNGAALIGFTLTNGATSNSGTNTVTELSGAAVWCESSDSVISNCVLTHSYASHCGGAAYQGTLNNCVISNNTASLDGGGTYLANVDNSIIVSNGVVAKGFGGGGAAYGVSSNCLITGNSAPDGGGAYYSTLAECQISRNGASVGGGLYACVANNSLIFGNVAHGDGGGAYNCSATNCTIVLNTATTLGEGGGVYGGSLMNCVVYDNIAFGSFNFYFPSNVLMNYCCTTPFPTNGIGNITNEPIFVNFNGSDFHLQSNSPCINAGNNAYVTSTTDLDGNPRIVGGTVDIGAYEYQTPTSIISYAWLQQYGLPTDGSADFADYDGTGMNVYQDWIAGLNPTNVLSVLAMLPPAPTNNPAGLVVSWESVSNRTYFLQSSTNLGAQPAFSTIQSNLVGQPGTTSYTDTNAVGNGPFFYRVGVQ